MANKQYFHIKNYSSNGEMVISRRVFEAIALEAITRIKGATAHVNKSKSFGEYKPVNCEITKNNKVDIRVDVKILKGFNVQEVCNNLKEEISQSLMLTCEIVPFNITINVASIEA